MSAPMLTCAETFRRLDDYLDRELSADEMSAVEAHLHMCVICAGEFEVEKELLDDIREKLGRVRMPAELRATISARLEKA